MGPHTGVLKDGAGWVVFGLSAVVTFVFFIDLCNAVYGCGCQSLWRGAAAGCNVHRAGVQHCPWCEGKTTSWASLGSILAAQAATCFGLRRRRWWSRLAASVSAFFLVGLLAALVTGHLSRYWSG